MWHRISEFMNNLFRKYKKPVCVLVVSGIIYNIFGVSNECGMRCPAPPMTSFENFLSTVFHIIIWVCVIWIVIIHMTDKHNDM